MNEKTRVIEITFPVGVNLPLGFEQTLDSLITMACKQYEKENPDRVMWPAGVGGKPLGNIMLDDNIDFDMSYLCIDVAEREDLYGRNEHNPKRDELRKKANEDREARRKKKQKD